MNQQAGLYGLPFYEPSVTRLTSVPSPSTVRVGSQGQGGQPRQVD